MKTVLYNLRERYRSVRSASTMLRIKLGLYRKICLPPFDWDYLFKKWPYKNPNVYINDISNRNEIDCDLSVIIPLYNSEAYLPRIIKMFLSQETDYEFELILVNDGSIDKTKYILDEVESTIPFARVINQKNGGISKARNTGISNAHGRYIAFMDHDDEISSDYIQKLLDSAYTEKAEIVKCWYGQKYGNEIAKTGSSAGFIWAGIIEHTLFEHIRFPDGYWYEDMINNFVIKPQARKVIEINEVLYYKVSTNTNASKKIWKSTNYKSLEHIYLIQALIECYLKLGLKNKEYLFMRVLKECSSLAVNRTKDLDPETRMQAFQACCAMLKEVQSGIYSQSLSKKDKLFYQALIQRDYSLWIIAANL